MYNLLTSHFLGKNSNSCSPVFINLNVFTVQIFNNKYVKQQEHKQWRRSSAVNKEGISIKRQQDLATQIRSIGWLWLSDHSVWNPISTKCHIKKSFPSIWVSIVTENTLLNHSSGKEESIDFCKILSLFLSKNRNIAGIKEK